MLAVAMGAVRTCIRLVSIEKVHWNKWPKVLETNELKMIQNETEFLTYIHFENPF